MEFYTIWKLLFWLNFLKIFLGKYERIVKKKFYVEFFRLFSKAFRLGGLYVAILFSSLAW